MRSLALVAILFSSAFSASAATLSYDSGTIHHFILDEDGEPVDTDEVNYTWKRWTLALGVTELIDCFPGYVRFVSYTETVFADTGNFFRGYTVTTEDDDGNQSTSSGVITGNPTTHCAYKHIMRNFDGGMPAPEGPVPPLPPLDTDGDGKPDSNDPDDDNDGTPDISDPFPKDPNRPTPGGGTPPGGPGGPGGPGTPTPPGGGGGPGDPGVDPPGGPEGPEDPEDPGEGGGVVGSTGDPNSTIRPWSNPTGNRLQKLVDRMRVAYTRFMPTSEGNFQIVIPFETPGTGEIFTVELNTNPTGDDFVGVSMQSVRVFFRAILYVTFSLLLLQRLVTGFRQVF